MQQFFPFVSGPEIQLSLPLVFGGRKRVSDLDAETWAARRAEDQQENSRNYRR